MKITLFVSFCLLFIYPFTAQSQEKMNADSLYFVARQYSIDGKYEQAIELSEKILEKYPSYYDVRILMARTYAWQNDYDNAVKNISHVLAEDSRNYEALNALTDFYFWSGDNRNARSSVEQALVYYPEDVNLLVKKARIELADNDSDAARMSIDQIEKLDPMNESLPLLRKGAGMYYSNIIRLEHYYDGFDKPYKRNWQMSSIGYGRRTDFGDYYAKVYVGDLIIPGENLYSNGVGKQLALECYPKIDQFNSMFVNYAWSPDAVFPRHRAGLEYYRGFRNKMEFSLGYRYLNFNGDTYNKNIHILTGSLSKYIGKFWLSFRPYVVLNDTVTSSTWLLSGRYFLPKEESYIGLTISTGVSPDNPYFYTGGQSVPNLSSWRIEPEWKQKISSWLLFELQVGYENAEYQNNLRRDQFSARTSISFLF